MSYAPLADLKSAIKATNNVDDGLLQAALDAASEAIDDHCDRTFVADVVATIRYFSVESGRIVVDDIWTAAGFMLSVGGIIVPAAVEYVSYGYLLGPRNAPALGEPYTEIEFSGDYAGTWPIPTFAQTTTAAVTAKWGYAEEVPPAVYQACLLQASRIFSRKNSPYGVAGSPDLGSELRLLAKVDPDVAVLLAGKVRY